MTTQVSSASPLDIPVRGAHKFIDVVATDHPDIAGGIVWSRLEINWINSRLHAAHNEISRLNAELEKELGRRYAGNAESSREFAEQGRENKRLIDVLKSVRDSIDAAITDTPNAKVTGAEGVRVD